MAAGTKPAVSADAELLRGISTADALMAVFGLKRISPTDERLKRWEESARESSLTNPAGSAKIEVKSKKG
jgi:hypothetical protein